MRRLSFRLLFALMGAGSVAWVGLFVGYLFWEQANQQYRLRSDMRVLALELIAELSTDDSISDERLRELADSRGMALTILRVEGSVLRSTMPGLPTQLPDSSGTWVEDGYQHLYEPFPKGSSFQAVIVSASLSATMSVLAQRRHQAVLWFLFVAVVFVLVGMWLLRRAVVRPITRLTTMVGAGDHGALLNFGEEDPGELGQLGRTIIGMTQRIEEDQQQIAGQLSDLEIAHADLASAQQQLVRAERLAVVGQLAAGVVHELGNPLAVVSGYLEVLRVGDVADDKRHEAFARMAQELERIHTTMRHLLDFSRPSDHVDSFGDITEALSHVTSLLRPQADFRSIDLVLPKSSEPRPVTLGQDPLIQLILNLLLNAADAMDGQGTIRVDVSLEDERVVLTVDDSGPGIDAAIRGRVFEPFFTTKERGRGTGLGLPVCERLVQMVGGEIQLVQGALGGACFEVVLPTMREGITMLPGR